MEDKLFFPAYWNTNSRYIFYLFIYFYFTLNFIYFLFIYFFNFILLYTCGGFVLMFGKTNTVFQV